MTLRVRVKEISLLITTPIALIGIGTCSNSSTYANVSACCDAHIVRRALLGIGFPFDCRIH